MTINLRVRLSRLRILDDFFIVNALNFSEVLKRKTEIFITTAQKALMRSEREKLTITLPLYPLPARHLHPHLPLLFGL